jgi:GGDEF domain-containing protein
MSLEGGGKKLTSGWLKINHFPEGCSNLAGHDGKEPKPSVTSGVATYPEDGETMESLLCNADRRLYRRKQRRSIPAESSQATGDF